MRVSKCELCPNDAGDAALCEECEDEVRAYHAHRSPYFNYAASILDDAPARLRSRP